MLVRTQDVHKPVLVYVWENLTENGASSMIWSLGKGRNNRIFNNKVVVVEDVVELIKVRIAH